VPGVRSILLERWRKGEVVVADIDGDLLRPFHWFRGEEAIGHQLEEAKEEGHRAAHLHGAGEQPMARLGTGWRRQRLLSLEE
jgi:hypothetical protein